MRHDQRRLHANDYPNLGVWRVASKMDLDPTHQQLTCLFGRLHLGYLCVEVAPLQVTRHHDVGSDVAAYFCGLWC